MVHIGLGYLSLDRESSTLSGGEAQRTKMVRHLGSALTDVTYVFDEPTVGLHAHDIQQMNGLLQRLRDKGNTVLVVEHEPRGHRASPTTSSTWDPAPGRHGGEIVYEGSSPVCAPPTPLTGRHLDVGGRSRTACASRAARSRSAMPTSTTSRTSRSTCPLGVLVAVTGVAGSGKSSLIHGCMPRTDPSVTVIDQSAIRGSRRSNPATYTGILRPDPQGVRIGQRREAGAVQRQLGGRLPGAARGWA